ncbi:MAG: PP2C family serine/threonine-protein phosphatase [Pyrinomonadaceae bacterium]
MKNWRIVAASGIGKSHLDQTGECQDAFKSRLIRCHEGEVLIAVVADGAGSTREGKQGALLACDIFVDRVESFLRMKNARIGLLGKEFAENWIQHFQAEIKSHATRTEIEIREFASTLVGAVVGETEAVFFQVGDGGIVISQNGAEGSYEFAIEPEDWEYANVTDFLTDEDAVGRIKFCLVNQQIEDLILFSDGVYSVAVDQKHNSPFEPFLIPMISPVRNAREVNGIDEKLHEFLVSERINEKTDDDKTLLLASRA